MGKRPLGGPELATWEGALDPSKYVTLTISVTHAALRRLSWAVLEDAYQRGEAPMNLDTAFEALLQQGLPNPPRSYASAPVRPIAERIILNAYYHRLYAPLKVHLVKPLSPEGHRRKLRKIYRLWRCSVELEVAGALALALDCPHCLGFGIYAEGDLEVRCSCGCSIKRWATAADYALKLAS